MVLAVCLSELQVLDALVLNLFAVFALEFESKLCFVALDCLVVVFAQDALLTFD